MIIIINSNGVICLNHQRLPEKHIFMRLSSMPRKTDIIASCLVASILSATSSYAEIDEVKIDVLTSPVSDIYLASRSSEKIEAIVMMKDGFTHPELLSKFSQTEIKTPKQFRALSSSSQNKDSYALVSGSSSTEELISMLMKDPTVKSVSANYSRTINALPDDPRFGDLWAMHNTGQTINGVTGVTGADINAPEVWNIDTDTSDAVIAVFDTGAFYSHEDLIDNMWINEGEIAGDGIDNDGNGFADDVYGYDFAAELNGANDSDPIDIDGHGTHVSGIIGAKGNNGVGITGVNWNVKIMTLKVFRPNMKTYDSDILEAINYVLMMKRKGVNIVAVNASYGSASGSQTDPMNAAIKSLGEEGIMFVAAAGNGGSNNAAHYPSSYDAQNIISVAASNQNDALAEFSNYGIQSADLAAPGANILSTMPGDGQITASVLNDDVESGGSNWTPSDTWAITEEESKSATHAWSDSPSGEYANSTNSSLVSAVDADLTTFAGQNTGLGMCMKYDIEDGWDYLHVEVSGDSGTNWNTLKSYTGTQSDWKCNALVIPETVKTANFKMRFRLQTDRAVTADGAYIDNITIGAITTPSAYQYDDSTSMAAPHVTSSIAMIAKHFPDENMLQRVNRVLSGSTELTSLSGKVGSGGRLNIAESINPDLVYRPMILAADKTEGLIKGSLFSLEGIEFGEDMGKVYFSNGHDSKVEGVVNSWSDTKIKVRVPENAGQFISLESASQKSSVTSLKGSAWEHIAPLGEGPRTFATAVSYKDKIYVFGGIAGNRKNASAVEVYDPVASAWSKVAPMPTPRYMTSAAVLKGKIYLVAGIDSNRKLSNIIEVYDPATDTWAAADTIAPLPKALFSGKAVTLDGSLYYVGGAENAPRRVILNTLYKYNEADNTWSEKASMSVPRITHEAITYNGKIYAFGGHQGSSIVHAVAEAYNPQNDSWTTVAEMPTTLWFLSATTNSKGITIAGGDTKHHNDSNKVMHYIPATDTWIEENGSLKELIVPKVASSLVYLSNRGYYLIGGGLRHLLDEVDFLLDNNLPIAQTDVATVDEDSSVDIAVLANDTDGDGGTPKIVSATMPNNGVVTINGEIITYMPESNFHGSDSFSYVVEDIGGAKDMAAVLVTVKAKTIDDDKKGSSGGSLDKILLLLMAIMLSSRIRRRYFK